MTQLPTRLSDLSGMGKDLALDRSLLRDLAAETLRDRISDGRIPEGTKLTEREVLQMLGISRMPARDALMQLQAEGLVVQRPDGCYVIELTEEDVRSLYTIRWTVEKLAVELAAATTSAEHRAVLMARLDDLERAVAEEDPGRCTRYDMAIHRAIWQQASNPYLLRILDSVLGAMFVLCDCCNTYGQRD